MEILWIVLGVLLGSKLPDVDLVPILWRHRSAWTHGVMFSTWFYLWGATHPTWQMFCAGALAGIAGHLLADSFPKHWAGGATIKLAPIPYSLPPIFSAFYIFCSALMAGWMCWVLLTL